jgi:hypothetical protein
MFAFSMVNHSGTEGLEPRIWLTSELSPNRELLHLIDTRAFVATNPKGELITGLPGIRQKNGRQLYLIQHGTIPEIGDCKPMPDKKSR